MPRKQRRPGVKASLVQQPHVSLYKATRVRGTHRLRSHITNKIFFLSLDSYRSNSPKFTRSSRTHTNPNSESVPIQNNFTKNLSFTVESYTQNQKRRRIHMDFEQVLRDSRESSSLNWRNCSPNASTPPEVARCKRGHSVGSEKRKGREAKDFTALDRRRRKKAYQWGSESKNQRNGSNLRITNTGNT